MKCITLHDLGSVEFDNCNAMYCYYGSDLDVQLVCKWCIELSGQGKERKDAEGEFISETISRCLC